MTKLLENKVAIVTGGASGIGRASVELFVEHGARVVIADIQDDLGKELASSLGDNALYVRTDAPLRRMSWPWSRRRWSALGDWM